jgi:predicted N-acetyltransferase YhbS
MQVTKRSYNNDKDHKRVMDFLRELYTETGGIDNWLPPRFENNSREMDPGIHLWEDDGDLVGFVVPENPLVYFTQLHPDYISLYGEMVEWLEKYSRGHWAPGKLSIVEMEGTIEREKVLEDKGYKKDRIYVIFRIRDLEAPIPDFKLSSGFTIRSVTPEDFDQIAACIRAVFGHGEWFTREILERIASSSFYVPDLDLVVMDREGKIVSFCTFRLDTPSGLTELEPMGTLAEYRAKGIGRALLCEGFRRLKKYSPSMLYIGGAANTPAANRLYEVTGFTQQYNYLIWSKQL